MKDVEFLANLRVAYPVHHMKDKKLRHFSSVHRAIVPSARSFVVSLDDRYTGDGNDGNIERYAPLFVFLFHDSSPVTKHRWRSDAPSIGPLSTPVLDIRVGVRDMSRPYDLGGNAASSRIMGKRMKSSKQRS